MTVETQQSKKSWIGDGSTTNYPYSYPFLNASDIEVYLDGEKQASGFSVQNKTDYSTGANIIFDIAPAEGVLVVIRRNIPMTQEISYPENGEFPAESHEKSLDKLTMLIINNNNEALKVNPATPEDFNPTFPVPEANKALKITADGKGFTMSDYDPDIALVLTEDFKNQAQQAAIEALSSQTAAANSETVATQQANIATQQANIATQQATIATNKTSEVVASGNTALANIDTAKNNAITSITNQETTSKNVLIDEGATQVGLVRQEGITRVEEILETGCIDVDYTEETSTLIFTGGGNALLSNYYTKEETDKLIPDITPLATKQELQEGLDTKQPTGDYALKSEIPTKVSSFTNDANYQTATDVASMIASIPQFKLSIVDSLPSSGQKMVLYLVPKTSAGGDDIYDEYIWIENTSSFELVGSTTVDLNDYYTKTETNELVNNKLSNTETWTFTLEDGTEVTKTMVLGA